MTPLLRMTSIAIVVYLLTNGTEIALAQEEAPAEPPPPAVEEPTEVVQEQETVVESESVAEETLEATTSAEQVIEVEQTGTGSQTITVTSSGETIIDADQNLNATNVIIIDQHCEYAEGTCIQTASASPSAVANGILILNAQSLSTTTVTQTGSGSQTATIYSETTVEVDATQNITATNEIIITQECVKLYGMCIQIAEANPTATATATLTIDANAETNTEITQNGEEGAQQSATIDASAVTLVTTDQNVSATNTITIYQDCTIYEGICIQHVVIGSITDVDAVQIINASAVTTTNVDQNGGNGEATVNTHSDVDIEAQVTAHGGTTVNIIRTCNVTHGACFQYGPEGGSPIVVVGEDPEWRPTPCTIFEEIWNNWFGLPEGCPDGGGREIPIPEGADWLVNYYNDHPNELAVTRIADDVERSIRKAKEYLSNAQKECRQKMGASAITCSSRYLKLLSWQ